MAGRTAALGAAVDKAGWAALVPTPDQPSYDDLTSPTFLITVELGGCHRVGDNHYHLVGFTDSQIVDPTTDLARVRYP